MESSLKGPDTISKSLIDAAISGDLPTEQWERLLRNRDFRGELITALEPHIMGLITIKLLRHKPFEDWEVIAQDARIAINNLLDSYDRSKSALKTYLINYAPRRVLDMWERDRDLKFSQLVDVHDLDIHEGSSANTSENLNSHSNLEGQELYEYFSERCVISNRSAFKSWLAGEISQEAIARDTGRSAPAVSIQFGKALKEIKDRLLGRFSEKTQEAVLLCLERGFKPEEAAALTGLPLGRVKQSLLECREALGQRNTIRARQAHNTIVTLPHSDGIYRLELALKGGFEPSSVETLWNKFADSPEFYKKFFSAREAAWAALRAGLLSTEDPPDLSKLSKPAFKHFRDFASSFSSDGTVDTLQRDTPLHKLFRVARGEQRSLARLLLKHRIFSDKWPSGHRFSDGKGVSYLLNPDFVGAARARANLGAHLRELYQTPDRFHAILIERNNGNKGHPLSALANLLGVARTHDAIAAACFDDSQQEPLLARERPSGSSLTYGTRLSYHVDPRVIGTDWAHKNLKSWLLENEIHAHMITRDLIPARILGVEQSVPKIVKRLFELDLLAKEIPTGLPYRFSNRLNYYLDPAFVGEDWAKRNLEKWQQINDTFVTPYKSLKESTTIHHKTEAVLQESVKS